MKFWNKKDLVHYNKKLLAISVGVLGASLLSACHSSSVKNSSTSNNNKLSIVTSFYPVYEFTKNIVGDEGKVELLVPAGAEPHDYEPSAKDMARISNSDLFIYHNANMETWVSRAQKNWKNQTNKVIEATKGMVLLPGSEEEHTHTHESEEEHHHEYDPHTWLSPKRAIEEVKVIEKQLVNRYPKKATAFRSNADKYLERLQVLDKSYNTELKNAKQKSFVTQHVAFRYMALDYGLNQISISGLNPNQEPSASRLATLKKYVDNNGIKYIYFENNANGKFAKTLANEANVKLAVLNPVESLTTQQIEAGENYISIMQKNLESLKKTTSVAGKAIQSETKTEVKQTVSNGYFSTNAVKDRELSDYAGNWQSVYPLLQAGSLDQVFDYKSKINKDKTASEYKEYYTKGYASDVNNIVITEDTMSFNKNGKIFTSKYAYKGCKILEYKKGNRGVRYLFEATDPEAGEFKYVQFSDHNIAPVKTDHFHIFYSGVSQDSALAELDNWPTYYSQNLSSHDIAQEMLAH